MSTNLKSYFFHSYTVLLTYQIGKTENTLKRKDHKILKIRVNSHSEKKNPKVKFT